MRTQPGTLTGFRSQEREGKRTDNIRSLFLYNFRNFIISFEICLEILDMHEEGSGGGGGVRGV